MMLGRMPRRPAPVVPSRPRNSRPARHGRPSPVQLRLRWGALALALTVVLGAIYCGVQLARSVPPIAVSEVLPARLVASGDPPALPVPGQGAALVEVAGLGELGGVRATQPLPLASVTKLMTALVVLHDHPLSPGQQGPVITITAAEAAAYSADLALDDSVAKVAAGERLTEFQALEALLVPSADNVADILATWDAGSVAAFVSRMNAQAEKLGLHQTHYADPAGLDPESAGSAADMVRLASYVMAEPVLRQIVAMPQVTLPVAGTVYNYDYDLGHDGIIGIKTGSTPQAGGNFVFAASKDVAGKSFMVIGAVLNQGGRQPLQSALDLAKQLSVAAFSDIRTVTLLPQDTKVLSLGAPWGQRAAAVTTRAINALGIPGEVATARVVLAPGSSKLRQTAPGQQLATVKVSFPGGVASVPAVAAGRVAPASVSYRLGRV
jgi:D-alanyl-D-alanine carboxypeptidase (penicillin-binding protein 5/6)